MSLLDNLPTELVNKIYEYDNTYKEKYDIVIKQLTAAVNCYFQQTQYDYIKSVCELQYELDYAFTYWCLAQEEKTALGGELADAYYKLNYLEIKDYISKKERDTIQFRIEKDLKNKYNYQYDNFIKDVVLNRFSM